MFCPGCGIQITEDIKFCKNCGANLRGVREAIAARGEQFDWSKTWVAEMFMTEDERERRRGVTPEHKRNNEIRAGVITTSVGIGAMIFLYFFLGTVARVEGGPEAEIISRVWLAGVVPFFIGLALLFNGLFLRKRELQLHERESRPLSEQTPLSNQIP
ncbi:MAG: zinc-ribbon domain-containing protein, partial [Gammaproteobacteria bacterium]